MSTAENIRHHAAGHLASAVLLVDAGQRDAAILIMRIMEAYVNHPLVAAPPAIKRLISDALVKPESQNLRLLEEWFIHPLNTVIEESGMH